MSEAMTARTSDILEIVGQLHDGVVDHAAWERAIDSICTLLDMPIMIMGAITRGGRGVEFAFGHRSNTAAISLLEGPLADPACNPWLGLAQGHPLRRIATFEDVGGIEALKASRMWAEFYEPFRVGDTIGAALERQPEFANVLMGGRRRDAPAFRAGERRTLQALLPHIARAWRVKRAVAETEALLGSLKSALDGIEKAVIVTAPDGSVRFANRAADALLSKGGAIDARQGRLRGARVRETEALQALIGGAAATSVGQASVAVDAVSLPGDDDRPALAVVAEPLSPAHGEGYGCHADAGAILFIGDSEASRCPAADRLQIVYGLTGAEAQVAARIVEGKGLPYASRSLNISPNTTKYHLKSVFAKVGVASQAQLVRRVLADVGGLAEPEKMRPRA